MAAVGFSDELRVEAGDASAKNSGRRGGGTTGDERPTTRERKTWVALEGSVGPDGKPIAAVGEAQLRILRSTREEVHPRGVLPLV